MPGRSWTSFLVPPQGQVKRVSRAPTYLHPVSPLFKRVLRRSLQVLTDGHELSAGVELHDVAREHAEVDHLADVAGLAGKCRIGRRMFVDQVDLLRTDREAATLALEHVRCAYEPRDELAGRVLVELGGGGHLLDAALVEDGDPVAHRERFVL